MRYKLAAVVLTVAGLAGVGCNRDPNKAKLKYLASGNKYFDKGKYREASIMYADALQKDQRFGPAYYKLGLTSLKLSDPVQAVRGFRRAVELIGPESPERWDSMVKLSELYLALARDQKPYLDEVEKYAADILKHDPNSFDGHRLTGDLLYTKAFEAARTAHKEDALETLKKAVAEYVRANEIKPDDPGVLMQLARAYESQANLPEAETILRKVISKDKSNNAAYVELYKLYMIQNKPQLAEQILKDAWKANPKSYNFLTTLALHYSLTGRRDDMANVLQEIKTHADDFDQAFLVVGDFYLRLGDGDSAIREYRAGISKDVKKKVTYQKRIIEVLMRQGKRAEAADVNSEILKADPNDTDAKGLAATFLLDKGDISRALSELQAVVTRAPENPVARYNLGRAHLARGEWEQARQAFSKAIELRPDYTQARLTLADLQVRRGEFEAALKTAQQILQIDRGNVNARLIESAALMGMKKFGDSHNLLDAMMKANPNSPDVHFQMGIVNLAENKYKEAEQSFRRSYDLNPTNIRGLMGVVETLLAQNRTDEALQKMQAEIEKNPTDINLRLNRGNIAVRAGKFDMALNEFQAMMNALDKNSNPRQRGDLYLRIGETLRRKGDDGGSVAALQKARELMPDNVTVLSTLALALDHAGRWTEAKQIYDSAVKLDSANGIVLNNLAFLMAEHNSGDLDDALTKAQQARRLLPNLPEVADTLGWIYLKKNMSDQAIDVFKDLVVKAPNQSTFRYHLGMALSQKGDKPRAIKELNDALKYNPAKEERDKIQQLLNRLQGA